MSEFTLVLTINRSLIKSSTWVLCRLISIRLSERRLSRKKQNPIFPLTAAEPFELHLNLWINRKNEPAIHGVQWRYRKSDTSAYAAGTNNASTGRKISPDSVDVSIPATYLRWIPQTQFRSIRKLAAHWIVGNMCLSSVCCKRLILDDCPELPIFQHQRDVRELHLRYC